MKCVRQTQALLFETHFKIGHSLPPQSVKGLSLHAKGYNTNESHTHTQKSTCVNPKQEAAAAVDTN